MSGTGNTGGMYRLYASVRTVPSTPLEGCLFLLAIRILVHQHVSVFHPDADRPRPQRDKLWLSLVNAAIAATGQSQGPRSGHITIRSHRRVVMPEARGSD